MLSSTLSLVPTLVVYVTTYLFHSTLLLGATWLVSRGFRNNHHRLREQLWKLSAVAALITTPIQLELNQSNPALTVALAQQDGPVDHQAPNPAIQATSASEPAAELPGTEPSRPNSGEIRLGRSLTTADSAQEPHTAQPTGPMAQPSVDRSLRSGREPSSQSAVSATVDLDGVPTALGILFGIIVVCGMLKITCDTLVFRRRLEGARLMGDGPARIAFDKLRKQLSISRKVHLLSSKHHSEPAAFGVLQWRIILPETIESKLQTDELSALLAHEFAHLVRGDTVWLWAGRLLCSCFAFQPLNFVARREWRRAAEFQCDDWAVEHGVKTLSLARCLTQVAVWKIDQQPCAVSLAAGGTQSDLSDRVERLVDASGKGNLKPSLFSCRLIWLAAILATLMLPYWGPRTTLFAQVETSAADGAESMAAVPESDAQRNVNPGPLDELQHRPDSEETNHSQEFTSWQDVASEADALQNEFALLEDSMRELTHSVSRPDSEPKTRELLEVIRTQLDYLNGRRRLVDAIRKTARTESDEHATHRDDALETTDETIFTQ
jgi:beta-lactamase regulating signal transducer with metallopeptidase domain